jgi:hypothetical protein
MRHFNLAGPCRPEIHYMLDAGQRLPAVGPLVAREAYFVIHAPRQSGKTTALHALARALNAAGTHAAVVLTAETGAAFPDIERAEPAVLGDWRNQAAEQLPSELHPPAWPEAPVGVRINFALKAWAHACPLPLVLLIDEIDSLRDEAMLSFLRQLRSGFQSRPKGFPSTIGLVGMRDVRDYVVASGGQGRLGSASPFNVKAASITLPSFTTEDVAALYQQHTADTGQVFSEDACARAFELTQGQPWLVNAIAAEVTDRLVTDRAQQVDAPDVDRARDVLIARQDTHIDSLAERLREPRVREVVEPLLVGDAIPNVPADDLQFVVDLGLLVRASDGSLAVANPIYREIIARNLATSIRASIAPLTPAWLDDRGRLVPDLLLEQFLVFWRQHAALLFASSPYAEAAPHLVLLAFLDRVANGAGRVEREYAAGSGRMDVHLEYKGTHVAMELKVWRDKRPNPRDSGLAQLDRYLAATTLGTGWLVVFDARSGQPPLEERVRVDPATTPTGRSVQVVWA